MKKLISIICLVAIFSSIFLTYTLAIDKEYVPSLYLQTTPVPNSAITYARSNIHKFLQSLIDSGDASSSEIKTYKLGSPFTLHNNESETDLYYFPIIFNQEIVATFRVYETADGYSGIFSKALTNELNNLSEKTTITAPGYLSVLNHNIYYSIQGKSELLWSNDAGIFSSNKNNIIMSASESSSELMKVNCFDEIEYTLDTVASIPESTTASISAFAPYVYLPYFSRYITETQGSVPWCAAYVAAFIVRYRNGSSYTSPTALSVMETMFPTLTQSELENQSLGDVEAVQYYTSCGFTASKTYAQISDSDVRTAITNGKPIHLLCTNISTYENHSMALVGYNDNTEILRIWNPWYAYGEDMDSGTKIYTSASGASFEWLQTITIN